MQEDAANLSKRARRRAEQASEPDPSQVEPDDIVEALSESVSGAEGAEAPGAEAPDLEPNRKARRSAAAQARARRQQELAEASALGLDAGEVVDDALARAGANAGRTLKRYWPVLQWLLVGAAVVWLVTAVIKYRAQGSAADSTGTLMAALSVESPERLGADSEAEAPEYESEEARLAAVREAYEAVLQNHAGSGAGVFARMARAGLSLEAGEAKKARAEFGEVAAAARERDMHFVQQQAQLAQALSAEAEGDLAGADQLLVQLASEPGAGPLARYHRARILAAQKSEPSRQAEAKVLLKELLEELGPPGAAQPSEIEALRGPVSRLALVLDPLQKEVTVPRPAYDPEALRRMLRQMQSAPAGSTP